MSCLNCQYWEINPDRSSSWELHGRRAKAYCTKCGKYMFHDEECKYDFVPVSDGLADERWKAIKKWM